jgi:alpha-tubulin suppressor-like RCC1 family protein
MAYEPTTNFKDSNNVDLGKKLVTKDYLLTVYPSILDSLGNSGLTVTPALWTWGINGYGQLGVNNTTTKSTPVTTILGGTNWKSVDCGYNHTGAIKTDGTLWLWGGNTSGELGNNGVGQRISIPITTLLGGTNWKEVGCSTFHTAAIKTDGTLWLWGNNSYGTLGNNLGGSLIVTPITTILGGTNWKSVDCGTRATYAIKTDGTLWLWGINGSGQLGVNDRVSRSTPVTTILGGNYWKSVAGSGLGSVLAIKTDGTLWCWGAGNFGQLGVNDTAFKSTPVTTILGGNNWKSVSSGREHTVSIKLDGTLWCWGRNNFGQLGVNDTTTRSTPVTTILGGTNWKSIFCGGYHTLAIKTDGTLWCWGRNNLGQLGFNDIITRSTPVTTILGGTNWKSADGGQNYTVAIQSVDYI